MSFLYYSYRNYSLTDQLGNQQDKDNDGNEGMTAWGEEWEEK